MFRKPIKEINAEFAAEEVHLDSIRQIVAESCAAAGLPRKQITSVLLAIEEGATNIIRHAYLYEKGLLRLRVVIYRKMIVFSLIDSGRSFRADRIGKLDLEKLVETGRRGGLGFYMVRKIMDSVEYISSAGRNELRMIKRIDSDPTQSAPLLRRLFNLRVKFSLVTLLVVTLIVSTFYYYINKSTKEQLYNHLDETALALATTVSDQAAGYILNRRSDVEFDRLTVSYQTANPFIQSLIITDTLNVILAHSKDIHFIRKPYVPEFSIPPGPQGKARRLDVSSGQLNYLLKKITAEGRELGAVHIFYSSEPIAIKLQQSWHQILLLAAGLMLFGVVCIFLLSNYFVAPILKITRRVRRFSKGDLESELPLEGAAEFFEISRVLNEMTTRLNHDRESLIERERMTKEIEVASQIQKTLLPKVLPKPQGLEIDAFYRAASLVGGDLYDVFPVGENRYCLVVADVSGKGVPASLVMSMLRTIIRIYARGATSARETMISVQEYLDDNMPPGMFVTVILGILNTGERRLSVVSAGHNPLLHYRSAEGDIIRVNPSGMPLGLPATLEGTFAEKLQEVEINLGHGDILLLYSDGITEANSRDGKQYGIERLESVLMSGAVKNSDGELSDLTHAIVSEVDSFAGFAKQSDDITFLLVRNEKDSSSEDDSAKELSSETIDENDEPDPEP